MEDRKVSFCKEGDSIKLFSARGMDTLRFKRVELFPSPIGNIGIVYCIIKIAEHTVRGEGESPDGRRYSHDRVEEVIQRGWVIFNSDGILSTEQDENPCSVEEKLKELGADPEFFNKEREIRIEALKQSILDTLSESLGGSFNWDDTNQLSHSKGYGKKPTPVGYILFGENTLRICTSKDYRKADDELNEKVAKLLSL
jgi:hypothetical protein